MSYTEIFTEKLMMLTNAFFRRDQDLQVFRELKQAIQESDFKHLNLAVSFLEQEGDIWINKYETVHASKFENLNTFDTFLTDFREEVLFKEKILDDYTPDTVAYKYIGKCTKIAIARYHAETKGLLGTDDVTRLVIRETMNFFLENCRPSE